MVEPGSSQHPPWRLSHLVLSMSSGASVVVGAAGICASAANVAVWKNSNWSFPEVPKVHPLKT